MFSPVFPLRLVGKRHERPAPNMIETLRSLVLAPPLQRERFHAVFLDDHRQFLGSVCLGLGRISELSLSLRELFQRALAIEARSMIIAHNHPSGDCRPSACDVEATLRISQVAQSLGIELVDHLIFAQSHVYSMRKGDQL